MTLLMYVRCELPYLSDNIPTISNLGMSQTSDKLFFSTLTNTNSMSGQIRQGKTSFQVFLYSTSAPLVCMSWRTWNHSTPLPFLVLFDHFCCLCRLSLKENVPLMTVPCTGIKTKWSKQKCNVSNIVCLLAHHLFTSKGWGWRVCLLVLIPIGKMTFALHFYPLLPQYVLILFYVLPYLVVTTMFSS